MTFIIVLSEFQRFHTVTEEKASSIIKMFLIQFINTVIQCLIIFTTYRVS
jgi:hypothetical protein